MKRILIITLSLFGVFAILYAAIFVSYLRERRVRADLQDQVDVLSTAVAKEATGERQAQLMQALATAQAEQAALRYIFPTALDATEIVAHVLDAAMRSNVQILSIQAQAPISITSETGVYEVLNYAVVAEGTLPDLKTFFKNLEGEKIGTLTIEELTAGLAPTPTPRPLPSVTPTPTPGVRRGTPTPTPAPTATPTPTPEPGLERYRITLRLQIYTRLPEPTPTPQP